MVLWSADGVSAADISGIGVTDGPDATRQVPIASVAKLMTAYVILPDGTLVTGGSEDGQGGGEGGGDGQGQDKPKKRGGRREAVECAYQPPRKLHLTPKQIEDGPVICGLCRAPSARTSWGALLGRQARESP